MDIREGAIDLLMSLYKLLLPGLGWGALYGAVVAAGAWQKLR